jgi:hypothetical protein
MFGLFSRGVQIPFSGSVVDLQTPRDFEFALSGRVGLPARKIASLVDLTDDDLLREAEGIRKLEQRFSEILSAAMESGSPVGPVLKALDLSLVSQDNDWRIIIGALNGLGQKHEEYKRIALIKYMQYLTARQEVIRTLYSHRQRNRAEAATQIGCRVGHCAAIKETILFDLSDDLPDVRDSSGLGRLPKGETIEIDVKPDEEVVLALVKHTCKIVLNDDLYFVDNADNRVALKMGQNAIGRDSKCEITMDADSRDISRKHLIVERYSATGVRLTDVSSLGTFAAPKYLERTSI